MIDWPIIRYDFVKMTVKNCQFISVSRVDVMLIVIRFCSKKLL